LCLFHLFATTEYSRLIPRRHGILEELLVNEGSRVSGYQLRLTGHSLGAGIVSILAFFLKKKFPDLKCLCFEPPGCTVSLKMADSCKDYLTSYVLGDDIVPRLSLESMEHLRDDILEMIARIRVTKHKAMNSYGDVDALLYPKGALPDSEFKKQLSLFHEHRTKLKIEIEECEKLSNFVKVRLYPPGKIVHLVNLADDDHSPSGCCSCCSKIDSVLEEHVPHSIRWVERDDLAEVLISSHFVEDHKSPNVLEQLERVAEDFGLLSAPFLPEE